MSGAIQWGGGAGAPEKVLGPWGVIPPLEVPGSSEKLVAAPVMMVPSGSGSGILPTREESINLGGPLILLIAKDQFNDSVLKYDRYQLRNICSEMNRNPGLWKLPPITVLRTRLLKIQKNRKQGHHGGKLICVSLSNSVNKNNLISVMTINLSKMELNDSLIKYGLANMRSLKNKNQTFLDYTLEHQIDVFLVTETWLKQEDEIRKQCSCLNWNGKIMNCVERMKNIRGGGFALIYNNGNKVEVIETNPRPILRQASGE